MGLATCCTQREPTEKKNNIDVKDLGGLTAGKQQQAGEAQQKDDANQFDDRGRQSDIDLDQIEDELERFKYMFPFYKMNLAVFQRKLERVRGMPSQYKRTEIVRIEDLKKEFTSATDKEAESWKGLWSNVEMLLKTSEFKVVTLADKDALKDNIPFDQLINFTSKLEISILALLWCSGTQK